MKSTRFPFPVMLAFSACILLLLACRLFAAPVDIVPTPVPTFTMQVIPVATNTLEPTSAPQPTDVPETPSCYRWDEVTLAMAGEKVCVYGVAYSHQGQSRIDFSSARNSFFLIDPVYYYPNLSAGSCIVAEEVVEVFDGKIPFMTIKNGLYKCEPWMQ